MKKLVTIALVFVAFAMASLNAYAKTYILYKVNGGPEVFLHVSPRDIDCSTFIPGPGIEIVDCWNE